METKKPVKIHEELEYYQNLWNDAINRGDKEQMSIYCEKVYSLRKEIFPLIVKDETGTDYLGLPTGDVYISVSWRNIGWHDSTIFHKIENHIYIPNEIGKLVNVTYNRGMAFGGSHTLFFDLDKKIIVINELKKAGYLIELN